MSNEEPPPSWAVALGEKVTQGFASVDSRLDGLETNLDIQGNSVKGLNDRMRRVETRLDDVEGRQDRLGSIVDRESQANMEQDAAIAQILTKVDALDGKLDVLLSVSNKVTKGVQKAFENPTFRTILVLLGTAIVGWLTRHGGVK